MLLVRQQYGGLIEYICILLINAKICSLQVPALYNKLNVWNFLALLEIRRFQNLRLKEKPLNNFF